MKARAVCKLSNGETAFIVEAKSSIAMEAIDKIKAMISTEFDNCFEADKWQSVEVVIERN